MRYQAKMILHMGNSVLEPTRMTGVRVYLDGASVPAGSYPTPDYDDLEATTFARGLESGLKCLGYKVDFEVIYESDLRQIIQDEEQKIEYE